MSSKGMKPAQRNRLAKYMDDFKAQNGGCVVCAASEVEPNDVKVVQPAAEFNAHPDVTATEAKLYLFGLCRHHAAQRNADDLSEKAFRQIAAGPVKESGATAHVLVIDLSTTPETKSFA